MTDSLDPYGQAQTRVGSIQGEVPLSQVNVNPDDDDDDDDKNERHQGHRKMLVVCDNPYPYYAVTCCLVLDIVSVICYLFVSFYSLFCRSLDFSSTSINTQQFDADMNKELYEPCPRLQFRPMKLRRIFQQNEKDGVITSEDNGARKSGGSSVFTSDQGIANLNELFWTMLTDVISCVKTH